ncbi:MAG TPA: TetR/AcrR family transcriptional regulator C-terminal ligand-binding domain-containing protein [Steroidobacteraceae bacterium]|nr:TetR/AcrR family transcriptional regulator C-terminal ligand-binding domain-containing protein [Steroidobacteraceae bacterium]
MHPKKTRGRPRSEQARAAVLQAAYDILVSSGFAAFSIDAVASRAGVARTTIHRWWASKGMLAIESFVEHILTDFDFHISDSASTDFLRLFEDTVTMLAGSYGKVVASIIAEGQRDPDTLNLFVKVYFRPIRLEAIKVVQAGIDSGEFRPQLDPAVLLDAGIGAVYARLLLQQPITREWTKRLAEQLLHGALAEEARIAGVSLKSRAPKRIHARANSD